MRISTVYITLAKHQTRQARRARKRLLSQIPAALHRIDELIDTERKTRSHWAQCAIEAAENGKLLAAEIAESRMQQCDDVLRSLDRTQKVLHAVREAFEAEATPIHAAQ